MNAAVPLSFATWQALLNNFAIDRAAFTGAEMGILQSLREIPGFLAFAVVFLLLILKEQTLAYLALALLGIGTAITGWFPSAIGLYCTTVLMSLGFHYFETVNTSLSLQWLPKDRAPEVLGRLIAIGSFTSIVTFGLIWLAFDILALDFHWVYLLGGGLTVAIALVGWLAFPRFPAKGGATQAHGVALALLLVLRADFYVWSTTTDFCGLRRLSDGGEIRL